MFPECATPMRPLGSGLEGASASLALLDDVHRHRLRRAALHLPLPSQERGPFQFSDRLLASFTYLGRFCSPWISKDAVTAAAVAPGCPRATVMLYLPVRRAGSRRCSAAPSIHAQASVRAADERDCPFPNPEPAPVGPSRMGRITRGRSACASSV